MLKALPLLINSWSIADRHDADGAVVCCFCILRKLTEALTPQGVGFFVPAGKGSFSLTGFKPTQQHIRCTFP